MKSIKLVLSMFILSWSLVSVNSIAGDKISPMTLDGAKTVTTEEAKKLFDSGALFIDVRKDKDWAAGRVADAVQLNIKTNLSEETMLAEMKKGDPAVIYCNGERCMRSSNACIKAVGWGFTNIYYYRDGYPAWKSAGYPVE
ncbi:MAG: rhodanese-like domain-containing protein [Pseudomonadota bacterium]